MKDEECDIIIQSAEPQMIQSQVYNNDADRGKPAVGQSQGLQNQSHQQLFETCLFWKNGEPARKHGSAPKRTPSYVILTRELQHSPVCHSTIKKTFKFCAMHSRKNIMPTWTVSIPDCIHSNQIALKVWTMGTKIALLLQVLFYNFVS